MQQINQQKASIREVGAANQQVTEVKKPPVKEHKVVKVVKAMDNEPPLSRK